MISRDLEILLVDDSSADVALTVHALQASPLVRHVHVARDGEEALNFLFCRECYGKRDMEPLPELILLDLKLPKVDGLTVLRVIKADARTRRIPVIALTASREDRDLAASYELGVNSYIQKPVDFDKFRETVATLALYWVKVNQSAPRQVPGRVTETPR